MKTKIGVDFDVEKFKKCWADPTITQKGLVFLFNHCYQTLWRIAKELNLGSRNRKAGRPTGWRKY